MPKLIAGAIALAAILGCAASASAQTATPSAGGSEAIPAQAASPAPAFDPRQIEMALWQEAQRGNTAREYQVYLDAYPNGIFAGIARARIDALKSAEAPPAALSPPPAQSATVAVPTSPPAPTAALPDDPPVMTAASESTEDNLDLSNKAWRDVQSKLTALGFYKRGIDGEVGPGTRKAISDWQKARNMPVSGYLNEPMHRALLAEATTTTASGDNSSSVPNQGSTTTASGVGAVPPAAVAPRPSSSASAPPRERRVRTDTSPKIDAGSAAVMGAILGAGAAIAIGRGIRRR